MVPHSHYSHLLTIVSGASEKVTIVRGSHPQTGPKALSFELRGDLLNELLQLRVEQREHMVTAKFSSCLQIRKHVSCHTFLIVRFLRYIF